MHRPQRKRPTITEHIAAAREQARLADEQSKNARSQVLSLLLCCLENQTDAIEKLYQETQQLRLRVEDLEDAQQNHH